MVGFLQHAQTFTELCTTVKNHPPLPQNLTYRDSEETIEPHCLASVRNYTKMAFNPLHHYLIPFPAFHISGV